MSTQGELVGGVGARLLNTVNALFIWKGKELGRVEDGLYVFTEKKILKKEKVFVVVHKKFVLFPFFLFLIIFFDGAYLCMLILIKLVPVHLLFTPPCRQGQGVLQTSRCGWFSCPSLKQHSMLTNCYKLQTTTKVLFNLGKCAFRGSYNNLLLPDSGC